MVPRGGIEPPTRRFSVLFLPITRIYKNLQKIIFFIDLY